MASLGERTCKVCGGLDGKRFKLSDKQEGVNFPPVHPNCRCTTIGYDPDDIAELENKQEQLSYEEWYKQYVEGREQKRIESNDAVAVELPNGSPKLVVSGGNAANVSINSLTNGGNGGTINKNSEFYERLRNGLINTTIDEDAQKNHILSKAWINQVKQAINSINSTNGKKLTPKSRLFKRYDPQLLVDAYAGKGRLVFNKTNGYNEFVTQPFGVGVTFDKKTGKYVKTNVIQIKYTSNGVHIFPTKEMS